MSAENHGKQATLVGPWGGQEGHYWDDGVHSAIRQVEIAHGAGVDSIRVEYDMNGRSVWSVTHGGRGGSKIDKVRLDYPDEYFTSIHGYYGSMQERGPVLVRSLTFETNKKTYGPFGVEHGTYFTFPKTQGKIVGFLGKSGWFLDAIGGYIEPIHKPIASNPINHHQQHVAHATHVVPPHKPITSNHISHSQQHVAHRTHVEPLHKPINSNPVNHSQQHVTHVTYAEPPYKPITSNHIVHSQQHVTHGTHVEPLHKPITSNHKHVTHGTHVEPLHKPTTSNPIDHSQQHVTHGTHVEPLHKPITSNHKHVTNGTHVEPLHKPITSNYSYHSQQYVVDGPHKYEYSMIQGSIGTNYDLIVAFKQKDGHKSSPFSFSPQIPHHDFSKQSEKPNVHEISHGPTKQTEQSKIHEIPSDKPKKIERVASMNKGGVVTSRPWGGNGGTWFDDGVYDGIRQINISRNVCIVSIRACYDQNGQPIWGTKNGGSGSFKKDKIVFDYPSEILTHLTGYYGPAMMMGPNVIKSLTFHTTKGQYGPYGEEQGEFFTTNFKAGPMIVGFQGRKGLFLDAIGVHILQGQTQTKPALNPHQQNAVVSSIMKNSTSSISPSNPNNQTALVPKKVDFKIAMRGGLTDEVVHRTVKDPAPYGTGPWGGEGGKPWDDGVFTGIKQIILTITDAICCIEIEYDRNGQSVWSVKHGAATGGQTANRVKLDYPNEVLTCIIGYYDTTKKEQGTKVIRSLTFHTSRRKYGPFGEELGTYFASGTTEGKVVGFHGRSSMYLDAIGVHMQHWLGNKKSSKSPSLMKLFS